MLKQRKLLTADEVRDLHLWLSTRLDSVGLPSQPEVALRILELSRSANSQIADYAKVLKNDQAITGRVLRLANSTYFAQRKPVTAIDRACVVLGIDRLKAISLGFHLSRAAQAPTDKDYSRQIWGESLYRACLAAELARLTAPALISESFVIGLMMDAGLPLMPSLLNDEFRMIRDTHPSPGRLARLEFDALPYTHVDVISVLARKWKFPDLLVKPLEWHHTKPGDTKRDDPILRLHRIAYVTGLVELSPHHADGLVPQPTAATPGVATAQRTLNVGDTDMTRAVKQSFAEYAMTIDMFNEVAQGLANMDAVMDAVQVGLTNAVDSALEREIDESSEHRTIRLSLAGHAIELTKDDNSQGLAYLFDSKGSRLLSHRFEMANADPLAITLALGLENIVPAQLESLRDSLVRLAA